MFKFKRAIALIAAMLIISTPITALGVEETKIPIDIKVNDQYIKTDVDPFLMDGTTYVPIRFVSAALGADEIYWNANDRSAVIKDSNMTIKLPIGKSYAYINGQKTELDEGTKLVSDRTFVPVRFVAETLHANVSWNQTYYIVNIEKQGINISESMIDRTHYSTDDLYWLARIIEAESKGEPMRGKIAVGNVILNRTKSGEYPSSIYGVIFDDNNGTQFQPVANGTIYNTPSSESIIAAKRALNGENYVGNSLFFLNASTASSSWIQRNRSYMTTIANHDFYL